MRSPLEQMTDRLRELQAEIEAAIEDRRAAFRYRMERGRVIFDAEVRARHRAAREGLLSFLSRTRLLVVLTAPFIYVLILPFAALDLFVTLYQAVCFPVYGIPKVRRRDYIVIDRQHLAYLNGLQKLNCIYCGYCNGLIGFVREVSGRTEAYWCPIKHASRVSDPHSRYPVFVDYGNEDAFQARVEEQRAALTKAD
ncbi:MAG: hypothetical protein GC186_11440 [Rhodobacteraceae bacterium]|nr:hypothetical protein [Paracoccaceae bacterium]